MKQIMCVGLYSGHKGEDGDCLNLAIVLAEDPIGAAKALVDCLEEEEYKEVKEPYFMVELMHAKWTGTEIFLQTKSSRAESMMNFYQDAFGGDGQIVTVRL